ncbi:MAG: hypothetical protein EOO40_04395 [Deltaproteobacteria bacterium]|nr:MAG: hypothetical protein EOO40_04395 [Deltaproteobacteria bacterium]
MATMVLHGGAAQEPLANPAEAAPASENRGEAAPGRLTYDDVAQACAELRAQGSFGVRDVYRRLRRGSMTSITRMVRDWRSASREPCG